MYQKDYILRMVEEMARVIAALVDLKQNKEFDKAYDLIEKTFDEKLGIEKDILLSMDQDELVDRLTDEFDYTASHLGMMAELLKLEADLLFDDEDRVQAGEIYRKALVLYNHVDKENKTYSFDRIKKVSAIKKRLELIEQTK